MTKANKACLARETVYDRCAYVGCYNGKYINGRRLFHFPSERDRRLEMWIERSGNFRLRTWAATSLRKAGLCGDHFDDKCFTNDTKKALRRNVVPRHYTEDRKFRKSKGEDTTANQENNKNNENNKNDTATEKDEDDPLSCDDLLSNPVESSSATTQTNGSNEGTSSPTVEFTIDETIIKTDRDRTPSPVVEFIVEELDESLIYEASQCERPQTPEPESSVVDPLFEYKEKVNMEKDKSYKKSTAMRLEDTEKVTLLGLTDLRVNRSDRRVRTYCRSKNNRPPKSEMATGESEAVTDEEVSVTTENDTHLNTHLSPELNTLNDPRLHTQLNPHLNRTLHLQLNESKRQTRHMRRFNKRMEMRMLKYRDENRKLKQTLRVLRQKVRRGKAREINFMKVREMLKNVDEFLNFHECMNPVARAMVKIALHKRNASYTKEERDLSMQLYRYSNTTYDRLRSAGCNFPGRSSIRRWISENDGEPSACYYLLAGQGQEEEEHLIEDFTEVDHTEMVQDMQEIGEDEMMIEAVEDAEDAIDDLVEHLEEQIEDAVGHEEYVEEILPDEDNEEK